MTTKKLFVFGGSAYLAEFTTHFLIQISEKKKLDIAVTVADQQESQPDWLTKLLEGNAQWK